MPPITSPRTAVVTGGASGIGAAIVARLAAGGHRVATLDVTPSETPLSYTVDVTDRAQIDDALDDIHARLGPVTVLVNAAGAESTTRFLDITFAEWQRVLDVTLNGVFHTTQAVLPDMLAAGWGRIVNISSSSTHSGIPMKSHYVAAKSGVNGLTKSLALEFGPKGVTVNAVPRASSTPPCCATPPTGETSAAAPSRTSSPRHPSGVSAVPKTSPPPVLSWPPTRRGTSPARSSGSMADATHDREGPVEFHPDACTSG